MDKCLMLPSFPLPPIPPVGMGINFPSWPGSAVPRKLLALPVQE